MTTMTNNQPNPTLDQSYNRWATSVDNAEWCTVIVSKYSRREINGRVCKTSDLAGTVIAMTYEQAVAFCKDLHREHYNLDSSYSFIETLFPTVDGKEVYLGWSQYAEPSGEKMISVEIHAK